MSTAHCTQDRQKHGLLSKSVRSLAVFMAAFVTISYGSNAWSATGGSQLMHTQWQAPGYPVAVPESMTARQQAFVARIKAADAPNGVILDARMNRNSELGVVLSPRVRLRDVRPLMTSLLRQSEAG